MFINKKRTIKQLNSHSNIVVSAPPWNGKSTLVNSAKIEVCENNIDLTTFVSADSINHLYTNEGFASSGISSIDNGVVVLEELPAINTAVFERSQRCHHINAADPGRLRFIALTRQFIDEEMPQLFDGCIYITRKDERPYCLSIRDSRGMNFQSAVRMCQ
ncbi:hypothetical protein ACUNE3_22630 [Serratia sp. IR-2025]